MFRASAAGCCQCRAMVLFKGANCLSQRSAQTGEVGVAVTVVKAPG